MASPHKTVSLFLCITLFLSGYSVEAGFHRRGQGLEELFAGGLLTLLFREAIGGQEGIGSVRNALGIGSQGRATEGRAAYSSPPPLPHFGPGFGFGGMGYGPHMLGFGHGLNMLGYGFPSNMLPFGHGFNFGAYGQGQSFRGFGAGPAFGGFGLGEAFGGFGSGPVFRGFGHGFNFGPMFGINSGFGMDDGILNGLGKFGPQNVLERTVIGPAFNGNAAPVHQSQERTPTNAVGNINLQMPNVLSQPANDRRAENSYNN